MLLGVCLIPFCMFLQPLRSLVSSPLARLAKVPFGWAELYCRYCSLLVGLKKGFTSNMLDVACLLPL